MGVVLVVVADPEVVDEPDVVDVGPEVVDELRTSSTTTTRTSTTRTST